MLSKIRYYVSESSLRNIYFGIFSSLLTYGSQIWGQFSNKYICRIQRIQNKAIRIINFAKFDDSSDPLYQKSKILKISDHVKLQNFLYVHDSLKGVLPKALKNSFQIAAELYEHDTRAASQCKIALPKARTQNYGIHSIKYKSPAIWNTMVSVYPKEKFHDKSKSICKKFITKHFVENYTSQAQA